jgi:hypothetical protein
MIFLLIAWSLVTGGLSAATVGYTNRFDAQPTANDWATLNVAGSSADSYDMDSDVNARITATGVAAQIVLDTGNPPTQNAEATWSSTGHYLQTRPTGNRYTALMGTFVNNTGTNWPQITFSYLHTIAGSSGVPEEGGKGTRVYYSFSGLANSWTNVPALNSTASANGSTNYRAVVNAPWVNGSNLFLLWVDDNASGSGIDSGNQIDNFFLPATSTNDFLAMLDELEAAATPALRGFDQGINSFNNIGNRVVAMVGSAETWDAYGTPALRAAVIARWRNRWAIEGPAMLRGLVPSVDLPGHVAVNAGGVRLDRMIADMGKPFFLNNGQLYEMGTMDGAFPPMAFMLGDQSGIWAPPVKALDGFTFVVKEFGLTNWALGEDGTQFSHDFASATFHFASNGWNVERLDFPAAHQPALFSRLTLSNTTASARTIALDFLARVNVRPDWRTTAQNNQQNTVDAIEVAEGLVRAWDPNLTRSLIVVGADRAADAVSVVEPTATMTHDLTVPAGGSVTVNFLVLAGMELGDTNALASFRDLAVRSDTELIAVRQRMKGRIVGGVNFSCSDPRLDDAFTFAKANLALLTADYRPYFPDVFLAAGVPVYPRLFANDSCMSLPGAIAAGLTNEVRGTLACLAAQTQTYGALTPHESATDGRRIGPANAQETPQFIATCARYFRWSGDRDFISSVYPLLKNALTAQRGKDTDGDGYPEGSALIETGGMGPEKLDAACWQHAALAALAEIATELGNTADATAFFTEAAALRTAIQRDWWITTNAMWADSLGTTNQPMSAGVWSVVFPLLTGVASDAQAQLTLAGLQSGWINQWGGVHTRQADISGQDSGVVTTELFASAAYAHGQADFGLRLLQLAAEAPRQARLPGGMSETIRPGGSDFVQLWSAGPFLEAVIEGMAGVQPNAAPHRADFVPQLPAGLEWFKLEHIRIGEHEFTLEHRRTGLRNVATLTHESGPAAFSIRFFSSTNAEFAVNGMNLPSQLSTNDRPRHGRVASCDLYPGDQLIVSAGETIPLPFTLVSSDSEWKYLDDGSDQGTAWRAINFNDGDWLTGRAQFGYGDGDESTFVRSNRLDGSRIITTYFRKAFVVTNAWTMTNLILSVLRDDGAIVFLNGTEVFRNNMPAGTAGYLTTANISVGGGEESIFFTTNINPSLLLDGTNLIAVEIHQQSTSSSDVSFNLALTAVGFDRTELTARKSGDRVELAWPLHPQGFVLESASTLSSDALWQLETNSIAVTNGENNVMFDPPPMTARFFRLRRP